MTDALMAFQITLATFGVFLIGAWVGMLAQKVRPHLPYHAGLVIGAIGVVLVAFH